MFMRKIIKKLLYFWKTWGDFIMPLVPPGVLTYLSLITDPIKNYIDIYYPFSYGFIVFLAIMLWQFLNALLHFKSYAKNSIENKLIVLEHATKINIFSKNDKDYCVVKLHIFNCSDKIIRATTDKKSTWIMIKSKG